MFECSEEVAEIFTALSKAQGAMSNPRKDKTVKVTSRDGRSYEFAYATLSGIIDAIRKPFFENGLCFTQTLTREDSKLILRTRIGHSSGQWIATSLPVEAREQSAQGLGSAITYAKRYTLSAICGIAADEDDDAGAAEAAHVEQQKRRGRPPKVATVPYSGDKSAWVRMFLDEAEKCQSIKELKTYIEANSTEISQFKEQSPENWVKHVEERLHQIRSRLSTEG
jgi:hypothetical protein